MHLETHGSAVKVCGGVRPPLPVHGELCWSWQPSVLLGLAAPSLSHPCLVGRLPKSWLFASSAFQVMASRCHRCLWGLLTVLSSDPPPPELDSWWARAKNQPWVRIHASLALKIPTFSTSTPPNQAFPEINLIPILAGVHGHSDWSTNTLGHLAHMLPAVPGAKLSIFEKDVRPINTFFGKFCTPISNRKRNILRLASSP